MRASSSTSASHASEVLRLVEFDAADQSPFTGMLEVEPAP
jgi:hypothetical protein